MGQRSPSYLFMVLMWIITLVLFHLGTYDQRAGSQVTNTPYLIAFGCVGAFTVLVTVAHYCRNRV